MPRITVLWVVAMIAVCASGCSGGSTTAVSSPIGSVIPLPAKVSLETVPMILDPSQVPPAPDPAVNNATVAGVDSNSNGIRDDVERWIAQTYPTSAKMRAAMAQMALNSQKEITAPNLSRESAYKIGLESMDAVRCSRASSSASGANWNIKDYMATVYNTRARFSALMEFQNTMGSRVFKVPQEDACTISATQLPN